jgi:type II secretory pathway pseudopilin PulG
MMMRRINRGQRGPAAGGFTLVETIASIVITATVVAVCSNALFASINGAAAATTRSAVHRSASTAMERVTNELRNITVTGGVPQITSMTAGTIVFGTKTITRNGTQLRLTDTATGLTTPLAENVTAFTLAPFDSANAAVALGGSMAAAQRIQVTITVTSGTTSDTVRTRVFIRSLGRGIGI